MDGWGHDNQLSANLNLNRSLLRTIEKQNSSIGLYATREGYIHATNSSMMSMRDTYHYSRHQSYNQSLQLAKRYNPNAMDESHNEYLRA